MKDSQGNPTGILKDNAMNLIRSVIPEPSQVDKSNFLYFSQKFLGRRRSSSRSCDELFVITWRYFYSSYGYVPRYQRSFRKLLIKITTPEIP